MKRRAGQEKTLYCQTEGAVNQVAWSCVQTYFLPKENTSRGNPSICQLLLRIGSFEKYD